MDIDIERIINGEPLPIENVNYPLNDQPAGFRWLIRQPTDYEYDIALSVSEAAEAESRAQPEVQAVAKLPPTTDWILQQDNVRQTNQRRIDELAAKPARTTEEEVELDNLREYIQRLVDPRKFNRADEIARKAANRARDTWFIRRLVVDQNGNSLFDPYQESTQKRWRKIGRSTQQELQSPLYKVLFLIQIAKNFNADQSSTSS